MNVASDPLHSIVTRIERPEDRLRYVVDRLMPAAASREMFPCRAFKAGAYLLGWDHDHLRSVCRAAKRRGSLQAYLDWRNQPPALLPLTFGPLPDDAAGYVYVARAEKHPHVIKIGWSADPDRRMKELRRETGEAHTLLEQYPGTKVDEAIRHIAFSRTHIVREWFFDPAHSCRDHPDFLPWGVVKILEAYNAEAA